MTARPLPPGRTRPATTREAADAGVQVSQHRPSVPPVGEHHHVWWNGTDRPYYCRTCGEPRPAPPVTPASDLRDELAPWLVRTFFWGLDSSRGHEAADMLLAGPLARLVREHAEQAAALDRVRALAEQLERQADGWRAVASRNPWPSAMARNIRRALNGGP